MLIKNATINIMVKPLKILRVILVSKGFKLYAKVPRAYMLGFFITFKLYLNHPFGTHTKFSENLTHTLTHQG